jgi:hypothetical protein
MSSLVVPAVLAVAGLVVLVLRELSYWSFPLA